MQQSEHRHKGPVAGCIWSVGGLVRVSAASRGLREGEATGYDIRDHVTRMPDGNSAFILIWAMRAFGQERNDLANALTELH